MNLLNGIIKKSKSKTHLAHHNHNHNHNSHVAGRSSAEYDSASLSPHQSQYQSDRAMSPASASTLSFASSTSHFMDRTASLPALKRGKGSASSTGSNSNSGSSYRPSIKLQTDLTESSSTLTLPLPHRARNHHHSRGHGYGHSQSGNSNSHGGTEAHERERAYMDIDLNLDTMDFLAPSAVPRPAGQKLVSRAPVVRDSEMGRERERHRGKFGLGGAGAGAGSSSRLHLNQSYSSLQQRSNGQQQQQQEQEQDKEREREKEGHGQSYRSPSSPNGPPLFRDPFSTSPASPMSFTSSISIANWNGSTTSFSTIDTARGEVVSPSPSPGLDRSLSQAQSRTTLSRNGSQRQGSHSSTLNGVLHSNDPVPADSEDADWNAPDSWAVDWEDDVGRDYATDSDGSYDADFDEFGSYGVRGGTDLETLDMVDMEIGSDSSHSGSGGSHRDRRAVGAGRWDDGGGSVQTHGQVGSRSTHSPAITVNSRALGFSVSTTYPVKIYRADESWEILPISVDVTVADLTKLLNVTMLGENEKEIHRLFLRERGRGEPL